MDAPGGDGPHAHAAEDLIPGMVWDDFIGDTDDEFDLEDEDSTDSDSGTDSDSDSSLEEIQNYSHDWKFAGEVTCLICGGKFTCKKFKLMVYHYNEEHKGLLRHKNKFECPKCAQILASSSFKDVHRCRVPKNYKRDDKKKKKKNQKRRNQKKKKKRSN